METWPMGKVIRQILSETLEVKKRTLSDSSLLLTNFSHIFARQLEALVSKGDVAVGISTSGNSLNVLEGVKVAKERGATTVGFTGMDGGRGYCVLL